MLKEIQGHHSVERRIGKREVQHRCLDSLNSLAASDSIGSVIVERHNASCESPAVGQIGCDPVASAPDLQQRAARGRQNTDDRCVSKRLIEHADRDELR